MPALSTLSNFTNYATLSTGDTVSASEHNTVRSASKTRLDDFLSILRDLEDNYAGTTEPTDKPEGKLYANTNNDPADLEYYYDGAGNKQKVAFLERDQTFSGDNTFSGANEVELADGSAGDPALSFNSDEDNGIYRPGADILGISKALQVDGGIVGVDTLSDANATITSASGWNIAQTPTTTRTIKFDNSFGAGEKREITNLSTDQVMILTANDDSEIGRLQPGETTTLKCISASPASDADWSVLGPGAWTAVWAYRDANQSPSSQDYSSDSEFPFDASIFDNNDEFDSATGRVTPKQPGYYYVSVKLRLLNYDGSGIPVAEIRKNGSESAGDRVQWGVSSNISESTGTEFHNSGLFFCDGVSDYISFWLNSGSDSSVNAQNGDAITYLNIMRIK